MNNLNQTIMDKIKAGEIDMKPKWLFLLQTGLLVSGVIVAALLSIYFLSFVFFVLQQSGLLFAPGFGFRGVSFFVMSSPWLLISASAAFLALLYFLVRQYSFCYQRPLLYSMTGVVLVALFGSLLIQSTPMHENMGSFMERNNVPVFRPLYLDALEHRPEGMTTGTISEPTESGFLIRSDRDEKLEIVITETTRIKPGTPLNTDERIMIFGERDGDTVKAFGVRLHKEPPYRRIDIHDQEGQVINPNLDRHRGRP